MPSTREVKVLVISRAAWRDTNNSGNTLTNFFDGWDAASIAQVYCAPQEPDNDVCSRYYQITDLMLLQSVFTRAAAGRAFEHSRGDGTPTDAVGRSGRRVGRVYDFLRVHRISALLYLRELLWALGIWQGRRLDDFIKSFGPDVVFAPLYDSRYMCSLTRYVADLTGRPVVTFIAEDVYSYRQFSLSPAFWVHRFLLRRALRRTVEVCSAIYVLAPKQLEEYSRVFRREMKLLSKTGAFADPSCCRGECGKPIRMVYTGNLLAGRWRTLAAIGRALKRINAGKTRAELRIYAQGHVSRRMQKALSIEGSVMLMGSLPFGQVRTVLSNADVAVHVESFALPHRLLTRLSFSTKLVDYFESGRCVFAVGWDEAASIDYLARNDAAIVAASEREMEAKLRELVDNPQLIVTYGRKAWECGRRNHQSAKVRADLHRSLRVLAARTSSPTRQEA